MTTDVLAAHSAPLALKLPLKYDLGRFGPQELWVANPLHMPRKFLRRFIQRIRVVECPKKDLNRGPCWEWTGTTCKEGRYGQVNYKGKKRLAHRLAYRIANDKWPDGVAAHQCNNSLCVKPAHIGDECQRENNHEMLHRVVYGDHSNQWDLFDTVERPFVARGNSTLTCAEEVKAIRALGFPQRPTQGQGILLSIYGDGHRAAPNFFAKVTMPDAQNRCKVLTNDDWTLNRLLAGKPRELRERVIVVDDCGGGFPIGGLSYGVYDNQTGDCHFGTVDHTYFQDPLYGQADLLPGTKKMTELHKIAFANGVMGIINQLNPDPAKTTILICCGDMNIGAKNCLRALGFCVELERVVNPLQDNLEKYHRRYVSRLCGKHVLQVYGKDYVRQLYREHARQIKLRGKDYVSPFDLYRDLKEQALRYGEDRVLGAIIGSYRRGVSRICEMGLAPVSKTGWEGLKKHLARFSSSSDLDGGNFMSEFGELSFGGPSMPDYLPVGQAASMALYDGDPNNIPW